jgi:hypothetical protein
VIFSHHHGNGVHLDADFDMKNFGRGGEQEIELSNGAENLVERRQSSLLDLIRRKSSSDRSAKSTSPDSLLYELVPAGPDRTLLLLRGSNILMLPGCCSFGGLTPAILNWVQVPTDSGSLAALLLEIDCGALDLRETPLLIEAFPYPNPIRAKRGSVDGSGPLVAAILSMIFLDVAADKSISSIRWTSTLALAKRFEINSLAFQEIEGRIVAARDLDFRLRTFITDGALPHAFFLSLQGRDALAMPIDMKVTAPDATHVRMCEIRGRIMTDESSISLSQSALKSLIMFSGGTMTSVRLN